MSALALVAELEAAAVRHRPVAHIRITPDAPRGSPVAVPITPERARTIRLIAVERDGELNVVGDPEIWLRSLEVVIHPADWREVLLDADPYVRCAVQAVGPIWSFMGVKVIER